MKFGESTGWTLMCLRFGFRYKCFGKFPWNARYLIWASRALAQRETFVFMYISTTVPCSQVSLHKITPLLLDGVLWEIFSRWFPSSQRKESGDSDPVQRSARRYIWREMQTKRVGHQSSAWGSRLCENDDENPRNVFWYGRNRVRSNLRKSVQGKNSVKII